MSTNKVIYIEPVNTLLSCSNDTSLRVWQLKGNDKYIENNSMLRDRKSKRKTYRQGSISVLQNHTDYVRTMDYAYNMGRIFSASDDGKLFLWDLSVEKVIQKYNNFEEFGNFNGFS